MKCEQLLSTIIRGKVVRAVSAFAQIVVTFQQIINKGRKIMKKRMKKLASLLLSVSMTFSMISFPVYATPADDTENETAVMTESPETEAPADATGETTEPVAEEQETTQPETTNPDTTEPEEQPEVTPIEENYSAYTVRAEDIDVSGVTPHGVSVDEEDAVEVDENDPVMSTIEEELQGMTVLNEEGEKVPLTDEQKQQIIYMWEQYQDQCKANANLLGVQQPFFLSYNDDNEDGLGALGEMLVLAGHTVDEVRTGDYSFDDLMGMIQNFYYADQFGIDFYGKIIAEKRDEALNEVEKSGAKTLAQKILVLNDWIAHQATFDMAYIMKGDTDGDGKKDDPLMVAENPEKHPYYDTIYEKMYQVYEKQIGDQFRSQIKAGVEAQFRQQYYEGAIKQGVIDGYKSQVKQQVKDQALEGGATEEEAEAAAENYMEENADQIEEDADAYATQYMEENAEAISEDALGFITANFGEEAAAQIRAGADAFIEEANTEGVEVDPVNAPGYKMKIDEIVEQQMDEPLEDLGGMTPNEAIPVYAEQAATGLTQGILGAWEGNHIGILAEGTGVCAGYSKALSYLLQYMSPEYYGVNGAGTDMSVSENWKTPEDLYYDAEGNLDVNQDYLVDMVRITFDAETSMFGETGMFGEVHFWNAVKVYGKWYYVDPCYTDIYVECMSRDRVEIDGTMNHMYFLFSDNTARELYDGNMKEIASLYQGVATDTSYEDSWFARVSSNAYSDGQNFYYLYDSTDQLSMMREFNNMDSDNMNSEDFEALMAGSDPDYKLVYHSITESDDSGGADSDFTTLINFNPKDEDDNVKSAEVYDPESGNMVENELLTNLFAKYKDECDIYPSIKLTAALYSGKLYFNLSNCILSYDLSSGAVSIVKEYDKVSGKRDITNPFGGMAFTTCSESDADFTFTDRPIAAMTIKENGTMYVSVATNLGFISGKESVNDISSYGYEYEESNYNPNYSNYTQDSDYSDEQLAEMGYSKETNDNDEFMWSAVFVDTIEMGTTCDNNYETVTETFCGRDGYTENRCTKCGAVEDGSRVVNEGTACDHHYVHFYERYYTKDDNGNWNSGDCYVCTVCGFAIEEPTEPTKNSQESDKEFEERQAEYEEEKAIYDHAVETAGHTYEATNADNVTWGEDNMTATVSGDVHCAVCEGRKLDALGANDYDPKASDNADNIVLTATLDSAVELTVEEDAKTVSGSCDSGLTINYTATGTTDDGKKIAAKKTETKEAGRHDYVATWTWAEVEKEEGEESEDTEAQSEDAEIPYKATAKIKCSACGDAPTEKEELKGTVEVDTENSVAATCEKAGKTVYKATASYTKAEGEEPYTFETSDDELKVDEIPATGHEWSEWETVKAPTETEEGEEQRTCSKCGKVETNKIAQLSTPSVQYRTHVQDHGWEDVWKTNGEMSGTSGESRRLEAIEIKLVDSPYEGSIEYSTHIQDIGWQSFKKDGNTSGTEGQSKRLEAIQIRLTGEMKEKYHVYYRVHAQDYGWLGWAKDGEEAGTAGFSKRLEAIEIVLVKDGDEAPKDEGTNPAYIFKSVSYRTHVQDYGWQSYQSNGATSGTTGKSKRLEAIQIKLENQKYSGSIQYKTHIQDIGWETSWKSDNAISGTSGKSKRLEAIRIQLTGEMEKKYDVYYRVHAQSFGWMGWAKNGEPAGTEGYAYRLEGIQIVLVEKDGPAPGTTKNAFSKKK